MASVRFIQARISGKQAEILNLTAKLERICEAEKSGWKHNPYSYTEFDKVSVERDLETAKAQLEHYENKLKIEQDAETNRNIPVILDFLALWKSRNIEFYQQMLIKYLEARKVYSKEDKEYCNWFNKERFNASAEERTRRRKEREKSREIFNKSWGWIQRYIVSSELDMNKLNHDLDMECKRKYDNLVSRVTKIVREITDVSNLTISDNMELNGYIVGTSDTVEVQTIGAGGWNIQRFHFRTLVKKIK